MFLFFILWIWWDGGEAFQELPWKSGGFNSQMAKPKAVHPKSGWSKTKEVVSQKSSSPPPSNQEGPPGVCGSSPGGEGSGVTSSGSHPGPHFPALIGDCFSTRPKLTNQGGGRVVEVVVVVVG